MLSVYALPCLVTLRLIRAISLAAHRTARTADFKNIYSVFFPIRLRPRNCGCFVVVNTGLSLCELLFFTAKYWQCELRFTMTTLYDNHISMNNLQIVFLALLNSDARDCCEAVAVTC